MLERRQQGITWSPAVTSERTEIMWNPVYFSLTVVKLFESVVPCGA